MEDNIHPEIPLFLSEFNQITYTDIDTPSKVDVLIDGLRIAQQKQLYMDGMAMIDKLKDKGQINPTLVIKLRMLVLNPEMTYSIKDDGKETNNL